MMRKEIKNIGTVLVDEITLCDSCFGVYIPIKTESEKIKKEREKFELWMFRDVKKHCPDVNINECTLFTETDLHIHTGCRNENGQYEMYFSFGFVMWFEDKDGEEIYTDISDLIDIELSEDDKKYVKRLVAHKIVDALI